MYRLFLFSLLILPAIGLAQRITISEDISIRNDKQYELLGKLKDRFLVFLDKPNEYRIQAYDMSMRLSWDKEIELEGKRAQLVGLLSADDHFFVFYTIKKKDDYFLKMHQYDAGASLVDSATVCNFGSSPYAPKPQLIYSENKTKILIHQFKRQSELFAASYDLTNRKILWEMMFTPSDFNIYRDIYQWAYSDKGDAFFIIGLENRKARKDLHNFRIYHCAEGNPIPATRTVAMDDQLTYDVKFVYDNLQHKLVGGGFYSEKNRGKANGSFYLKIDPAVLDNHQLYFFPFEDDFVSEVMEAKENQSARGMENVNIIGIVLRQDGGILLIAELTKEFERRMASASRGYIGADGSRYIVDYYHDDMFIISIHPNGEIHWQSILHKKQYSQDDNGVYSSFFMMKTPSTLRFLYNDDIKNENTVSEYLVDGYGISDRNSVMSTENQDIQLRFRDAVQFGPTDVVVPSERRHRLRLVKLEF
jgi:hypothetical protein